MLWTVATLAAAQLSSVALEPSEPWVLSSQDDGCTVRRAFGDDHSVLLGFQTSMQSRPAFLLIQGPSKLLPRGIGEIPLSLDGAPPVVVHYGSFETPESGVRLTKLFPDAGTLAKLSEATMVSIGAQLPTLHVSSLKTAVEAVDRCTADKLAKWGLNPALYFNNQTAKITGKFAAIFDAHSFPKEARKKGAYGRLVLLLITDTSGAITDCKVLISPDPSLDAGTCEVAKRGRLKPPVDTAGRPIPSFAIIPVQWARP